MVNVTEIILAMIFFSVAIILLGSFMIDVINVIL